MTAPAGYFSERLLNPGEALTSGDFNLEQRYMRALILDGIVGPLRADLASPTTGLFAMGGLSGAPTFTATARTIVCGAGTILQPIASSIDGEGPQLLPYYLGALELSTQLAVGDAVNPRIDLICVKLEHLSYAANPDPNTAVEAGAEIVDYASIVGSAPGAISLVKTSRKFQKRRWVGLTKVVVVGTPAAIPTEPACPAGYARWAAVYVPANHNAAFTTDHIRDHRFPIGGGLHRAIMPPWHMRLPVGVQSFALQADGSILASGAGADAIAIMPAHCGRYARVLKIEIDATITGAGSILLERYDLGSSAGTTLVSLPLATTSYDLRTIPIWGNGRRWPDTADDDGVINVLFRSGAAGDSVRNVRFHVAT